ncbi:MAG TPA: hypothetical protein VK607_07840, partial [Kofleriaceae bacterium]|nr:hypothetical protein [Kofleriaceae bacterium]
SDGGVSFRVVKDATCVQRLVSAGSALYATGTRSSGPVLLTSTDGGSSWTPSEITGIPSGVDVTSLVASDDGSTIYLGTQAGLYKGAGR